MKRAGIALCLILIMVGAIFAVAFNKPDKALALAPMDQACQYGMTPAEYTWMSHTPAQTFIPTKGMLDAIALYLDPQIGTSVSVKVEVIGENQGGVIASATVTIPDNPSWVTFDLTDVATPLGLYGIKAYDADPNKKAVWHHGPGTCYERGYAIYDDVAHAEIDYRFATYGYDSDSDAAEPQDTTDQPGQNPADSSASSLGTSRGTGQAPAATTSSSIVAPSNLVAADLLGDSGGTNKLIWNASATSSIDGYKIFRSEKADSDFIEIGRTNKGFVTYLDTRATTGQTFYYFVRAYKSSSESASSNVASAASFDDIKGILDDYKNNSSGGILGGLLFFLGRVIVPLIIFGLIFILIIIGIILLVRRRRQSQNQTQSQPENQKTSKE